MKAKNKEKNKQRIMDAYPDLDFMFADGYDAAIVGVVSMFGAELKVCYNQNKVISILMKNGMTYEEAWEWFDFNIIGAFEGDKTPVFIELLNELNV